MGTKRGGEGRRPKARRRGFSVESLERRALLATASGAFVGPSLTTLITQAEHGKNTYQAQVNLMVDALDSQLANGPLVDLETGATTPNGFIGEAQALAAGYEQYSDQQLGVRYPGLDQVIKLQGQRVVANLVALNQEESVGLISAATLASSSRTTINSLASGPIFAIGTKPAAITAATTALQGQLTTLENGLGNSSLAVRQVATTLGAEAEAYRSDVQAGIQVTRLRISGEADTAINALELTADQVAQGNASNPQVQLSAAINAFDSAVLDTTGLFGPKGAIYRSRASKLQPGRSNGQAASKFAGVSGSSSLGGTSTLTATLTSSDGSPLMGESVALTVGGAFAGVGVTNFHGVATVAGVASTGVVGNNAGIVIASFASDTNFLSTASPGDLVVNRLSSTVTGVSGAAVFGGPATLNAMLTSSTGQVLAGRTVSFTLDGKSVGSAVTDGSGLASLAGVATTNSVGTDVGGIVAGFAGDASYTSGAKTGNFVVSRAPTTLSNVGGTASFGATATLTATLTSSATRSGISGQVVNFTLGGKSVGSALTDANGVASLTGVANPFPIGTNAGSVVATFSGSSNESAASAVAGSLVVSPAGTLLSSVSGTASVGGTATLTATLTSLATNSGFADQAVSFSLSGKPVGSALTNSSGVATLTGVATTAGAGTDAGAVVAIYHGDVDHSNTTSTGNLVVGLATSTLAAVSGTAEFGGTATLTATLTSSLTNLPLSGQAVTFTLSGKSAGTAVTNASGVASVSGVAESVAVGTLPSAVVASYAGTANIGAAANSSGSLVITKAPTTLTSVSGAAPFGGTATLTATLKSAANGQGVSGEPVSFLLGGKAVGKALTNASGVATLSAVPTTAAVGTGAGAVIASFPGDANYGAAAGGTGDLVVSKAATTLAGVAGTASFGGTASLTATLTSSATNSGVAGETVSFVLNGMPVGTAVTNGAGVATLTGVAAAAAVGTEAEAVVVKFAGDSSYASSSGAGDLVVTKAATSLGNVGGTATFGGTATLTAKVNSSVTNSGVSGQTVNFILAGKAVGTAVTDSGGVATLTGVATSAAAGTDPGAVVATFAGNADFDAAANGTGDLVVAKAASAMMTVSGSARFGGPLTVTAALSSSVTDLGIVGEVVTFRVNNTVLGTAITGVGGVATFTGGVDTLGTGTYPGAIVATFAGDVDYLTSSGSGYLIVN